MMKHRNTMDRLAIVLFNLGGPDEPAAVQPFLFNLFNDRAILDVPKIFRWVLAKIIAKRRTSVAQDIYAHIGGRSPLLELTQHQAQALEKTLKIRTQRGEIKADEIKTFVCMRYWHPMSGEVTQALKAYDPTGIVLLPLYPQYSTTTTQSTFLDWQDAASRVGLKAPVRSICCYPTQPGFITAQAKRLCDALKKAREEIKSHSPCDVTSLRVLFSAHGLPKKIVERKKDPYPDQVKQTAQAVVDRMSEFGEPLSDWKVAYQSRVGLMEWIGPSIKDEISRAGEDHVALVVLPIAFVSEHSETLVELDIEYARFARSKGVKVYVRALSVGTHVDFIQGLSDLVVGAMTVRVDPSPQGGENRICTAFFRACPAHFSH